MPNAIAAAKTIPTATNVPTTAPGFCRKLIVICEYLNACAKKEGTYPAFEVNWLLEGLTEAAPLIAVPDGVTRVRGKVEAADKVVAMVIAAAGVPRSKVDGAVTSVDDSTPLTMLEAVVTTLGGATTAVDVVGNGIGVDTVTLVGSWVADVVVGTEVDV